MQTNANELASVAKDSHINIGNILDLTREVGTGEHWGHVPLPHDFAINKQRALFIFRNRPFSLIKKVPLKCRAPKFEIIPTSLDLTLDYPLQ